MLRIVFMAVSFLVVSAPTDSRSVAIADDPAPRQVKIDPLSRNFMSPFMEDFIRPDEVAVTAFLPPPGSPPMAWT